MRSENSHYTKTEEKINVLKTFEIFILDPPTLPTLPFFQNPPLPPLSLLSLPFISLFIYLYKRKRRRRTIREPHFKKQPVEKEDEDDYRNDWVHVKFLKLLSKI